MELLVGFHYVPKRVPVKVDMEPWVCPLSWTLLGAHVAFFPPAPSKQCSDFCWGLHHSPYSPWTSKKSDPPAVTNSSCLSWIQRGTCDLNAWWRWVPGLVGCWVGGVLSAILWPQEIKPGPWGARRRFRRPASLLIVIELEEKQSPCVLEATLSQIFFPVSGILSDTPLEYALLAPPLNSLPQWLGSAAPNLGRQSSLAEQLALPGPQNQLSRRRQADPHKTPAIQKRLLVPRRAGSRSFPSVHLPPPASTDLDTQWTSPQCRG